MSTSTTAVKPDFKPALWTPGDSLDVAYSRRPVQWIGSTPRLGKPHLWSVTVAGSMIARPSLCAPPPVAPGWMLAKPPQLDPV